VLTVLCSDVTAWHSCSKRPCTLCKLHCPKPLHLHYYKDFFIYIVGSYTGSHLSMCLYTESDLSC